ncbi:MAG: hypothetical protein ABEJ84_08025 [Halodesulfurarchaeum sp.]
MTDTDNGNDRGHVPIEALQDLVDQFRERADDRMSLGLIEASDGINKCADELEAVIEEHE